MTQTYEWLVPVHSYGQAHAFVARAPLSVCVRHERWPMNQDGWEREGLMPREPHRARCHWCQQLIAESDTLQEGSAA